MEPAENRFRSGIAYTVAAFLWWGFAVLYFKSISHVPTSEILAHRIVWSVVFLWIMLALKGQVRSSVRLIRSKGKLLALIVSALILASNWYIFIWAIEHEMVLQTSLGYFINPLVNILLGFVFLRERLNITQSISVLLAFSGVAIMTVYSGHFPFIAIALAVTFSVYGLLRKRSGVGGIQGLAVEVLVLLPLALFWMIHIVREGTMAFLRTDRMTDLLLPAAGMVTSIPLIWFVNGAQRLRYTTVGFIQYLLPTMTFLIAIFIFHEPFSRVRLVSFICVWVAILIYIFDTVRMLESKESPGTDI